jgi:hypothetical protein
MLSNVTLVLLKPIRHFVFLYFVPLILTWYLEHGLTLLEKIVAYAVEFPKVWE